MRAVHDGQDARRPRALADLGYRKDHRGRAGDVSDEDDPRPLGDAGPETLDEIGVRRDGQGDRPLDITGADLAADVAPGAIQRAVFVVGRQDFVAGSQS